MDRNELKRLIEEATARGDLRAVARILEIHADMLVDEARRIADTSGFSDAVANQIAVRQWVAGRYNRRSGDRVPLDVKQTIDIDACLAAARKRLRQAQTPRSVWQRLWDRIRGR